MAGRDDGDWLEFVAELMREPLAELPLDRVGQMLRETFGGDAVAVNDFRADGTVDGRLVPGTAGVSRTVVEGPEAFGPRQMDLAERVWRLLRGLERQAAAYAAALHSTTSNGERVATSVELTPRERGVLGLLAEGHTAGTIGRRLGIAERTVHKHLERCYGKLGVADRLSAVLQAQRLGLVAA